MTPNPLLGVLFHWLGGFASASFYVPFRGVKRWNWEITNDLMGVMAQVPSSVVGWCIFFGFLWGFGGLTYGLTMRYLGLSLGMAVV
ncbi:MAG: rhamnose/proton symporter RhaT, partial [Sphingobium sp.]